MVELLHNYKNDKVTAMRETFILKGLDCPNCGAKIEHDSQRIAGVKEAHLNLIKEKIDLELEDDADLVRISKKLTKVVHKYEPDVKVIAPVKAQNHHCHFTLKGLDCPNCAACQSAQRETDAGIDGTCCC